MAGDEGASDIVQNAAMLKKSRLQGKLLRYLILVIFFLFRFGRLVIKMVSSVFSSSMCIASCIENQDYLHRLTKVNPGAIRIFA